MSKKPANNSTEGFGCCGFHAECLEKGDCVRKSYWKNYDKICSLWKKVVSKAKSENVDTKESTNDQYGLFG